jgi:cytochrome c biogenesis protein CcmG/thiol:disulfide interchange protein DsbE
MGVLLDIEPDVQPVTASNRRFLWLVPVIVLFVVGGVALFKVRQTEIGKPPPDVQLASLEDGSTPITLSELTGKVGAPGKPLVVNFWASWCEPCREEAPEFAQVAKDTSDQVTFLGVNMVDGINAARLFASDYELPYDSMWDNQGVAARAFKVTGAPETFFIDPEGRVVGRYIGALQPGQLGPLVQQLISLPRGETMDISGRGETRPLL